MTEIPNHDPIILASASIVRSDLLRAAGIEFSVQPSGIDEAAVRQVLDISDGPMPPADVGLVLAEAKARAVAALNPGTIVIGADQILALDTEIFSKPDSIAAAHRQLKQLRGRTHELHAGICCVRDNQTLFRYTDSANLTVRDFSDDFLQDYLNQEGEDVCASVGAYKLEGRGVQLFSRIEGDYFTILGLPLVPLLEFLRSEKVIAQ
jgi:septum formation protein